MNFLNSRLTNFREVHLTEDGNVDNSSLSVAADALFH